jgi:hypothetical protein
MLMFRQVYALPAAPFAFTLCTDFFFADAPPLVPVAAASPNTGPIVFKFFDGIQVLVMYNLINAFASAAPSFDADIALPFP